MTVRQIFPALLLLSIIAISGCASPTPPSPPITTQTQNQGGTAKLCGDWPPPEMGFIEKTTTMPSDFPSSSFLYPESTLVGKTFNSQINSGTRNSQGEITEGILYKANLYFCTDDSVGDVISYYNNLPPIDGYQKFFIEDAQSFGGGFRTSVSEKNIKTTADYTWYYNVLIEGMPYSGKTVIHIIYAEFRDAL